MSCKSGILSVAICGLLVHGSTLAIVSMEDLHTGKPNEGFTGDVQLSMSSTVGNVDKQDYSLGSRLQWHEDISTSYILLSGAYGEVDGVKNTEKTFLHTRHIHQFRPTFAVESYVQQETNKFARIDYRRLLGGGIRFTVYEQEETGNAYLGLGAYYSQQKITPGHDDEGTDSQWRASSYLILKYQATENTVLASTTYYQPAFGDMSDYRALQEATVRVRMSERLSLLLSANVRYHSKPPDGVEKREAVYRTGLSVEF